MDTSSLNITSAIIAKIVAFFWGYTSYEIHHENEQ